MSSLALVLKSIFFSEEGQVKRSSIRFLKKNDLKAQKEETVKTVAARSVSESGVMLCRHCGKVFERQQCLRAHEDGCLEKQASRANNRKTVVLRPAAD